MSARGSRFHWRGIEVSLAVPGEHNAVNAAGALTASALAGADPARAAASLADFQGARRRFELLGTTAAGVPVYDDYAHHPTEVAATIAAARTLAPERLVAVFQPHLYSRTRALARDFGRALAGADIVVVLAVYPARERAEDFPGVDGHLVAASAADFAMGRRVAWLPAFEDASRFLSDTLRPGDLVSGDGRRQRRRAGAVAGGERRLAQRHEHRVRALAPQHAHLVEAGVAERALVDGEVRLRLVRVLELEAVALGHGLAELGVGADRVPPARPVLAVAGWRSVRRRSSSRASSSSFGFSRSWR